MNSKDKLQSPGEDSETRFRIVSELTSDYSYAFKVCENGSLQSEWVTGALVKITGFTPEELTARGGWESLLFPQDLKIAYGQLKALLDGREKTVEYRITARDGSTRWMLDRARPEIDAATGKVVRLYGAVQDITEQKLALQALEESEQKFRAISEGSLTGITIIQEGRVLYVNQTLCEMTGYSSEEIKSFTMDNWSGLIHSDDLPYVKEQSLKKQRGEGDVNTHHEYRIIPKAGGELWVDNYSRTITLGGGPAELVTLVNIDEKKRNVEEKLALADRLRQSEKMEAIGKLAGGIAHDFNNQLSGILGCAQMLQESLKDNPELLQLAEIIEKAVDNSTAFIDQLLAFSRKGKSEDTEVDIHLTISEVISLLSHTINKNITIHSSLQATAPFIQGDPVQLQNALLNMAFNARDAMPGGGTLTFSTGISKLSRKDCSRLELDILPGRYLCISVSDTGTGIDRGIQKHIFEPFFTTKGPGEGTGLGLAAVYGTVKNHGGAIGIKSAPGKGTTFSLFFPPAGGALPQDSAETETPVSAGETGLILIADDEEIIRISTALILQKHGHKTRTCCSGNEALNIIRSSPGSFSLVLLDMVMPGLGGKEAFWKLREINPDLKIMIISGFASAEDTRVLLDESGTDFLAKPLEEKQLAAKTRALLARGAPGKSRNS